MDEQFEDTKGVMRSSQWNDMQWRPTLLWPKEKKKIERQTN